MFRLGTVVMTHGVSEEVDRFVVMACLRRHMRGEWGDLDKHDMSLNDSSLDYRLKYGVLKERLFSAYDFDDFLLWVITEIDESVTTILFPSEY